MSDSDKFSMVDAFVDAWVKARGAPPPVVQPPQTIPLSESADGVVATLGVGFIVDHNMTVWQIGVDGVIMRSSVRDTNTQRVVKLVYRATTVYQMNQDNNWWKWTNNAWMSASDPTASPSSGTLGTWMLTNSGGTPIHVLMPMGTPKRLVLYLHQLGNENQVPAQCDPWFNNTTVRGNYQDVMFVVPHCRNSGNAVNWGGVSDSDNTQDMVNALAFCSIQRTKLELTDLYVTGNSMGGIGSWDAVIRYPGMFTAALILAGATYNHDKVAAATVLKDTPLWVIHGADDTQVPLDWDRGMSVLLGGKSMRYDELNGVGHDVWDIIYPNPVYLSWLLSQRRTPVSTVPPTTGSGGVGLPLPAGPLSTRGSQIVASDGTPVRLASIGWNQQFDNIPRDVKGMRALGFNCVRVSWVNTTVQQDLARIDKVVAACSANNMRVILDCHTNDGTGPQQTNGLWYGQGGVTDASFLADWVAVAKHYAGNDTVVGFDIRNEPTNYGVGAAWGPANGADKDLHAMYERVGNAIMAVNHWPLIICEGSQDYNQGAPMGDLRGVKSLPVTLIVPGKVVYSVHDYPSTIGGVEVTNQQRQTVWGWLVSGNVAPVWIGECGADMTKDAERQWASDLLTFINGKWSGGPTFTGNDQPIGTDWWVWGQLDGQQPRGMLANYSTMQPRPEQQAVWKEMLYNR